MGVVVRTIIFLSWIFLPSLVFAEQLDNFDHPTNIRGKGRFATCMRKKDYPVCLAICREKIKLYGEVLKYVKYHNESIRTFQHLSKNPGSTIDKKELLNPKRVTDKFKKWYQRLVVLDTNPIYKKY